MQGSSNPILRPLAISHGHYECRDLHETVPVLSHLLALEVIHRRDKQVTMKHPNTGWLLVVHEGGPDAPDKPQRNHYGVRVTDNAEVDRAYEYLLAKKQELRLKKVVMRRERAGSYSCFFMEPGGNYWEIESYEDRHKAGLPYDVSYPWKSVLTDAQFPGRGYIPQAFTHGTIECNDWASSVKFYKEGLGMDVTTHIVTPKPHNIKHPAQPWYVVSLEVPEKNRKYLGLMQRYTIAVATPAELIAAHRDFRERGAGLGIMEVGDIDDTDQGRSFFLCDLNRNWWEIASARH
ncbi:MAG TPA: VOC family protein [Candidatus Binatia bacterium]|jgi:catechol 2,3-dioxygenase-like lactoylglutathione lyase family enzyme